MPYRHRYHNSPVFSLVCAFSQKNKTYKIGLGVCVCGVCVSLSFSLSLSLSLCARARARVCVCVCVCVCVQFWSPLTISPIDTKFWLHIVSYRKPTPLIPFLNFENCARENFLKFIFSPFN